MYTHLAALPLFRAVPEDQLRALGDVAELRRFRKGETLFTEDHPAEAVWLIKRGWAYLVKRTPQGAPVTIFTVTPEEVLCGFSAAGGQRAYYASAIAATDTTAIRVPQAAFSRLLRGEPDFAVAVLAIYHTRMRHMAEAISLAPAPVEQRVAHTLLRLKASFGKAIPVTHKELARMAGTRLETSIRTVSSMKRRGWIASARGQLTVLAPRQLQALLGTYPKTPLAGDAEATPPPSGGDGERQRARGGPPPARGRPPPRMLRFAPSNAKQSVRGGVPRRQDPPGPVVG